MKNVTYINASAGSGKTWTLTHKLAELIGEKKVKPEQVIMTTFTVKAASEMREEAKKVLYDKGLFEEASRLDQAMIGTIHSVANSLINKYWFFLGLSPDMGVMAEEDTLFYTSQSLSDLPTHEELKLLHSFCEDFDIQCKYGTGKTGIDYDFWKNDILRVISFTTNYELDGYERSIKESLDFIRQFVNHDLKNDYTKDELAAILDAQLRYAETQRESQKKQDILVEIRSMKRGISKPNISWFKRLGNVLGAWKGCAPEAENIREQLAELWHWPLVYQKQEAYIRLLFKLAERWKERYSNFKKEKKLLDYNDMEKYMRNLLTDEKLSEEIARDYRYLFVDEYRNILSKYPNGFYGLNWSVYEWEDAHEGDRFYMLRTGDDKAGIVFRGVFTGEPFPGEDWAGKGKQRYYMDMECYDCVPADEQPSVNIELLEKEIPEIDWRKGHSGELLSKETSEKLKEICDNFINSV